MDRRTFVKTAGAGAALVLVPGAVEASSGPLRMAALVHTFAESGLHEFVVDVETAPHELFAGRIELVREDGMIADAVKVPPSDHENLWSMKVRATFERGERIGLRLHTSYIMEIDGHVARRLPEHLVDEPFGVYARDSDRRRAAQKAREWATRLNRTLYLGRDLRNGEYLAISGNAGKVSFRDRHYGEAPIVPKGYYWEKTLIAEGRAPWL